MIKKIAFTVSAILMVGLMGWAAEIPDASLTEWLTFIWLVIGAATVMYYTIKE